ncbi:MAG: hypothetical protein K6E83_00820 [Clostridium sp.]|nr:hypothetical protein [Clostridium sp.]
MKKLMIMLVLMLAVVTAVSCGLAETATVTRYHVTEVGISVELDSDIPVYIIGDQEISEGYTKLGLTKESMDNLLTQYQMKLHALINGGAREVMLGSNLLPIEEFDNQDEAQLESMKDGIENQFTSMGAEVKDITYTDTGIGKALYIHFSSKVSVYAVYTTQYSIIKEGRMVNLRMVSYNTWPNREEEAWFLKVFNSLQWEAIPEAKATAAPEGNVTYHLEALKMSLELPAALPVYRYGDSEISDAYTSRGITKEALDNMMSSNFMYLHSFANNGTELFVISTESEDLMGTDVTEALMPLMLGSIKDALEAAGATVTANEIAETDLGKSFHTNFRITAGGLNQDCEQYVLLRPGSTVVVRLSNYSGGLTEEERALLLNTTNSIKWDD